MSYMKWFAATVMVSAALAAVGCQSQSSNGEANKCSPCATKSGCSAKTVAMYDVTVDGMS